MWATKWAPSYLNLGKLVDFKQSFMSVEVRKSRSFLISNVERTLQKFINVLLSCFSCVLLFVTPRTVACQAPLSMGILQARILEWVAMPSSRGSFQPRSWTHVSHFAGRFFTIWATREAHQYYMYIWMYMFSLHYMYIYTNFVYVYIYIYTYLETLYIHIGRPCWLRQ